MSRKLSILLIGLYGLTLSQSFIPHVNYWMNRDFIASELCENRDRPELKCEGKCHLKKEIKKSANEQKEGQEVTARLMIEFFQRTEEFIFAVLEKEENSVFPCVNTQIIRGHLSGVFHPPKV